MKNVISASRRTDIPAFYLKDFMENIKTGSVEIANPVYRQNKRHVNLDPGSVAWIVFWSRNYARFLEEHRFFDAYQLFFHFTILPQTKLEKSLIRTQKALSQMENLSSLYGPDRIIWRYDPLVFWTENKSLRTNYDRTQFENLCREIGSFGITRCYISFAQSYGKFIKRFDHRFPQSSIIDLSFEKQKEVLLPMTEIAGRYGLDLFSCCNDQLLDLPGIKKGHCIDGNLLNSLHPQSRVSRAARPTRAECGCTLSIDIGDYQLQPCPAGCIYCYANPIWK